MRHPIAGNLSTQDESRRLHNKMLVLCIRKLSENDIDGFLWEHVPNTASNSISFTKYYNRTGPVACA